MKRLSQMPSLVQRVARREWRGVLQEPKGGVALDVTARAPFSLHLLDDDKLITGKRCDGLLVAETPPGGLTCFIELKGAIDPTDVERPFVQVEKSVEHFSPQPGGTAHGEEHHTEWRSQSDLPRAPHGRGNAKPLVLGAEHAVAGIVIAARGGTRFPSRWMRVGGRDVFVAVLQRHARHSRVALPLEEIERLVG
jgi:hypothetical protein